MYGPEYSLPFLGLVILFSVGEFLIRRRKNMPYDGKAVASSVVIAIGQALSRLPLVALIAAAFLGVEALSPWRLDPANWQSWVIGFFIVEFVYYWQHRFFHTVRWFWATHAVHHSPNEFTFPVAFRLGWTNGVSGAWLFLLIPVFLGVPPAMVGTIYVLNLQYQFFLHTEIIGKLGPLEWVFNTPSHHRVHHGSNPEYLDKNYGGVLIIFDRLFGTFARESDENPVVYGLTEPITSHNPFVIAFYEWRRLAADLKSARCWAEVPLILFGKPGDRARAASRPSGGSDTAPAPVYHDGSQPHPQSL